MKQCTQCGKEKSESEFWKNQYWCKACKRKYDATYDTAHPEAKKASNKRYREKHREEIIAYLKAYRVNNLDKEKERARTYHETHYEEEQERYGAYRKAHREEIADYRANHRERLSAVRRAYRETHPAEDREYRRSHRAQICAKSAKRRATQSRHILRSADLKEIEVFYVKAERLTKETGVKHSVDHIVPLQGKLVSGLHVPWNLQVIPLIDNIKKGNRLMIELAQNTALAKREKR